MSSKQNQSIVIANINDDRRGYSPYNTTWKNISLENRIPNIVEKINTKLAEGYIVGICEIQSTNAKILIECMKTSNYVTGKYNNSFSSMMYVVFYPEQIAVKNVWNKALTADSIVNGYELKSGDFIPDELRPVNDVERKNNVEYQKFTGEELFEKGILIIEFVKNNENFFMTVIHFGLGTKQRILQAERTVKILSDIISKDKPVFVCGDFNGFDPITNEPFLQQYAPILDGGYINGLDFNVSTFINPFPYDVAFLLKDNKKFYELLKILNSGVYTEEQLNEYVNICEHGEKKDIPSIALDNIFTKNCKSTPVKLSNEFGSDHAELTTTIIF